MPASSCYLESAQLSASHAAGLLVAGIGLQLRELLGERAGQFDGGVTAAAERVGGDGVGELRGLVLDLLAERSPSCT